MYTFQERASVGDDGWYEGQFLLYNLYLGMQESHISFCSRYILTQTTDCGVHVWTHDVGCSKAVSNAASRAKAAMVYLPSYT